MIVVVVVIAKVMVVVVVVIAIVAVVVVVPVAIRVVGGTQSRHVRIIVKIGINQDIGKNNF